jgi:hypothetical protein
VQHSSNLKKNQLEQESFRLAKENGVKVQVVRDQSQKKSTNMTGFAPGSHWNPLVPQEIAVVEPSNTLVNARAPIVQLEEVHRGKEILQSTILRNNLTVLGSVVAP